MAIDDGADCFCPSDGQLVRRYLRAKTAGKASGLPNACYFDDADVCSARPDELVHDHRVPVRVPRKDAAGGEQWLFFSPARFSGATLKRRSRTIDGTDDTECWHAEGRPRPVEGGGGFVQKFSYHVKVAPGVVDKPGWIMAEYTTKNAVGDGDTVLCKIYRSPRGPGCRKNESLASAAAKSRYKGKRKAAADNLEAAASRSSKRRRPRKIEEEEDDDVTPFAGDIESDNLMPVEEDNVASPGPGFWWEVLHTEEWQPEPQLVPAPEFEDVLAQWQFPFPPVVGEFTTLLTTEHNIDDLKALGVIPSGGDEDDAEC